MALPINVDELLRGNTIESERIEFKQSWNPEDVLHTMCAFANDMNNWGGGYIIIGIEEVNGKGIFPPIGLLPNQIDSYQKKVVELGHKIAPNYFPVMSPHAVSGRQILIIWCPAGDNRPYTAPISLSEKRQERIAYIRIGSETKKVNNEQGRKLYELAARIPFDDRINISATVEDLDLGLIRTYLYEVKSQLYEDSAGITVKELAARMMIAKGPEEDIRPTNVGLMFFSKEPERFFPGCRIEVVVHKDMSGRNFEEIYFGGAIQNQLRSALSFIKNQVIKEHVIKRDDVAEAERFYNYPYQAIEETLANAVYHRSYEKREPIEVQIWGDRIEILSFPGPVPPVDYNTLKHLNERKRIIAREYRNRRVGDFLKELNLTEGRGTGFPTIYRALRANGSPMPLFETDRDLSYFLSVIYARVEKSDSSVDKDGTMVDKRRSMVDKDGIMVDKDGIMVDKDGIMVDKDGIMVDKDGTMVDKDGTMVDKDGTMVDKRGSMVDKDGAMVGKIPLTVENGYSFFIDIREDQAITGRSDVYYNLLSELPENLRFEVWRIGGRATPRQMTDLILKMCSIRAYSAIELSILLNRNEKYLKNNYLSRLLWSELEYTIPEIPKHPQQKYKTRERT
ncbi:MAG: putative DNA binding domain-containing protein [Bacteroidales bacterium]|uniref:RNA-binding domain-containing protein n=1 Tax=Porphyromonas sp. TaxID=1924944 RepID=UPI00297B5309|nr:RNA-binding domain-containing protein [Porphyromonas sp.]MDD7438330.1 putative DNA binding domain-containing protein [Bacteroidales bacterium]MDY3066755.1 putative DNA binding domain-containing protein [Porphyromonas sp.]